MKELVVISGKGGTGKTCLTSSLAVIAGDGIICDCDVEAPNLHLVLRPEIKKTSIFSTSYKADLDIDRCLFCGLCMELCQFAAIQDYQISSLDCEGCGFCRHICPAQAISMLEHDSGEWYSSIIDYGPMLHARLGVGEQNSGKLVSLLRQQARELAEKTGRELIITDGPPGTGCPAIAAITGCTLAAIVTEPTLAAIHDMKRAMELCQLFNVKFGVIINKCDLDLQKTEEIKEFCLKEGIPVWGEIPFQEEFVQAIMNRQPPVIYSSSIKGTMQRIWNEVEDVIG